MTTTTSSNAQPAAAAAATAQPSADPMLPLDGPLVLGKKKRKKRRYSGRFKIPGRAEFGASKAAKRLANAVSDGIDTYVRRSNRSARKRRDGALKDLVKNSTRGVGKTLRKSTKVPRELTKALPARALRRTAKGLLFLR